VTASLFVYQDIGIDLGFDFSFPTHGSLTSDATEEDECSSYHSDREYEDVCNQPSDDVVGCVVNDCGEPHHKTKEAEDQAEEAVHFRLHFQFRGGTTYM